MNAPTAEQNTFESLSTLRTAVLTGRTSVRAVADRYLHRLKRLQPSLAPMARERSERVLAEADALDAQLAKGQRPGHLFGVPIAVKDLLALAGEPVASGTTVMADRCPDHTATVVHRLKEAGALIIGQTQLTEGAFGLHHPALRAPKNPWSLIHWPGVSSSGSAVAVASGIAVASLGTDTGGSIRFPAASCGLVGLKPTYGRVSLHGTWPLGPTLDHTGPLARSVADAAAVLSVIAGPDAADPVALTVPAPDYAAIQAPASLRGWRIGFDAQYACRGVEGIVIERLKAVRSLLESLGAELVPVTVPDSARPLIAGWSESCGVECAEVHEALFAQHELSYGPALRSLIQIGRTTSPARYQALNALRQEFRAAFEAQFEAMDLLLIPSMPRSVPTVAVAEGAAAEEGGRADYLTFTAPFNFSGHPTLSLPAGVERQSSGGSVALPCSIQLVAPLAREDRLIAAGLALEPALNQRFGALYAEHLPPHVV